MTIEFKTLRLVPENQGLDFAGEYTWHSKSVWNEKIEFNLAVEFCFFIQI